MYFKIERLPRDRVAAFRQCLLKEADRYFRGGDNRTHFPDVETRPECYLATLLDPRLKKGGFSSPECADLAANRLLETVEEIAVEESLSSSRLGDVTSTSQPDDDWALCLLSNTDSEIVINLQPDRSENPTAAHEVAAYLKEHNLAKGQSAFKYWAVNQDKYPHLCALARSYLSAPIGSVASERLFKLAKRTA